jgi:penicillin-binding protein 1C
MWAALSEIAPALIEAVLLKEDRWFYFHPGVNPVALARGAFRTYVAGERQGGSTITMQLARLLYGLNTKTAAGKIRQAALALWLEVRYAKREILETYLNVAPFGGDIQGVAAASRIYFGKAPDQLTLGEALTLAVIPQRPAIFAGRSVSESQALSARTQLADAWLRGRSAEAAERRQLALPIVARARFAMPQLAPHAADAILANHHDRRGRIDTTLDAMLQRLVEHQIQRYLQQDGDRGIRNAASLLVDTRDMAIRAWVGSADYWNEDIDGQVNGVTAKRSPGSTLKPFVYALALDQGLLHPQTVLRDLPTSFGPFSPENFDGRFFGPITAEAALIRSRNIPAVTVATQL